MKIVGSKGSVALGTLPLSCLVACLDTVGTKHVEALGQHGVLLATGAHRTVEFGLHKEI